MSKRVRTAFVHSTILVTGIIIGWYAHAWHYKDVCLDMGGGMNPGGYPICVIER